MFVTLEEIFRDEDPADAARNSYEGLVRERDYVISRIGIAEYDRVLAEAKKRLGDEPAAHEGQDIAALP